jgi:hypothetical protein
MFSLAWVDPCQFRRAASHSGASLLPLMQLNRFDPNVGQSAAVIFLAG